MRGGMTKRCLGQHLSMRLDRSLLHERIGQGVREVINRGLRDYHLLVRFVRALLKERIC